MKLAFVIQRYGEEISGGAELHCRLIAERFVLLGHAVHVYTTCATNYMTWQNAFPAGEEMLHGVTVHRFPVDRPRDVKSFNKISQEVYGHHRGKEREEMWMRAQGPYSSALFDSLARGTDDYDWVLFYNYLYCTTYFGLPHCAKKAILAPMAHDEPPIYLDIFTDVFRLPCALMYNTEEERDFIQTLFSVKNVPSRVVGMWAPEPLQVNPDETFYKKARSKTFVVYIGRIDASKGCEELVRYFIRYKTHYPSDLKLLFMGKGDMRIPKHPDIVPWGYAADTEKWQALRGAAASIIPSLYESLSISLLESFVVGRPVLVNGNCTVTTAHCEKSNGGLWYRDYDEFVHVLEYLRSKSELATRMGVNGRRYVQQNYTWKHVIQQYDDIFTELHDSHQQP